MADMSTHDLARAHFFVEAPLQTHTEGAELVLQMATEPKQRAMQRFHHWEPIMSKVAAGIGGTLSEQCTHHSDLAYAYGPMNFPVDCAPRIATLGEWALDWKHGPDIDLPEDGLLRESVEDWTLFLSDIVALDRVIADLNEWKQNSNYREPDAVRAAWAQVSGQAGPREGRPEFVMRSIDILQAVSLSRTWLEWQRGAFRIVETAEGLVGALVTELVHHATGVTYLPDCEYCGTPTSRPIAGTRRHIVCERADCELEHKRRLARERKRRQRARSGVAC